MASLAKNDARLEFRLNREAKAVIEQAAALSGQSISDFAVSALLQTARGIVEQHYTTRLSNRDFDMLMAAIEADAEPNDALRQGAERFKQSGL